MRAHGAHLDQRHQRHVRGDAASACVMQQHERGDALLRAKQRGVLRADGASALSHRRAAAHAHPQQQSKRAAGVRTVSARHQRIKLGGRCLQQLLPCKER